MAYLQGEPKCLTFKVRIFVIVKQFYRLLHFDEFCFPFVCFLWKISHRFYALFFKFLCRVDFQTNQEFHQSKEARMNEFYLIHSMF